MAPGSEQRCANCDELNPARAKFCLNCGNKLGASDEAPSDVRQELVDRLPQAAGSSGERRTVTVVFADLSGFTAYSEGTDVEDVRAIAQETAARLGEIVERYGGIVDKVIGDCVMAVFGAPTAHEDDPERAVRAAIDMQAHVEANAKRFAGLTLTIGMQTGEAIWAPIGPDERYTVLGDTVNTAARLQGAAGKGQIFVGLPTFNAVSDVIECEPLEPIKAKNKAEPVPAWLAVGVKGARRSHRAVQTALVGRDTELNRLREVWENVRTTRRTYGVTVIGSPGVGKSRLVEALTEEAASNALVLRGRCLPYGEGITYWPVIEMIQQAAGIQHDDDRVAVSAKLGTLLEGLGSDDLDEMRTIAVALANLIGTPTTPRGTWSATEISRGELHWGLRRIMELGAQSMPLVLVFEDLHWAEPTLLELIASFFDSTADAPILGIATGRPELTDIGNVLLAPAPNRRVIELDALTDEVAEQMVTKLVGTDIPRSTLTDLLHSAGGNPLFLEEIAQMWAETEAGSDEAPADLSVPSGLQALIDSRLDRLSGDERSVMTHAAVIGDVFWSSTIEYLEGTDDVAAALDELEQRDLIRLHPSSTISGQREYAFKHGLIRDAAYGRLTKTERATLHERCGTWIAELPGGQEEFAEIIAYHLEQACLLASELSLATVRVPLLKAAHALMHAGERAEHREGMREAERFLARAVDLLADTSPETAIDLRLRRARLLAGLARFDDATTQAEQVAANAIGLDRLDLRCRALATLAEFQVSLGKASEARANVDEAEKLAKEIGDPALRVRAMWTRAAVDEFFDGDPGAAAETLRSAVALSEEVGDVPSVLTARMRLGALLFNRGDLDEASRQFERAIDLAKEQGSLRHQAWLSALLGLIRYHCGPRAESHQLFGKAAEWMERTNDRYMHVQTLVWHAALARGVGDLKGSIKLLRQGARMAEDIGGSLLVNVSRNLADALATQRRTAEVREIFESARDRAPEEEPSAQAELLVTQAFALAPSDPDGARRCFSQALPILESQQETMLLGEARLAYARLLETLSDQVSAMDQLERARELFEKMGARETVGDIDADLARIRDVSLGTTGITEPIG